METGKLAYKVETVIETYHGDWTSEQIQAGEAGIPQRDTRVEWYEQTPDGPQPVTNIDRIAELEASIQEND